MAISRVRLAGFEALGPKGMKRWLRIGAEEYFIGDYDGWVFEPFGQSIGARGSLASDIKSIYGELLPEGKNDFEEALAGVLGNLSADPEKSEIWEFLIELAWLLPAPEAIKVSEWRFTDDFFDSLCARDDGLFDRIFLFVTGTVVTGPEAERCVSRLVASSRFNFNYGRHALLRLCEIAPDNWTRHFDLTRDNLNELFLGVSSDTSEQIQDELGEDILSVIGFARFIEGIGDLLFASDTVNRASDNWFWIALAERVGKLLVESRGGKWMIAPAQRPNDWQSIPEQIAVAMALSTADTVKQMDITDWDENSEEYQSHLPELTKLVDERLGQPRPKHKQAA